MLNLWGGDGAPFSVGGEWFIPLGTANRRQKRYLAPDGHIRVVRCLRGSIFHPRACCRWLIAASKPGKNQKRGYGQSRARPPCRRAHSSGARHQQHARLLLNLPPSSWGRSAAPSTWEPCAPPRHQQFSFWRCSDVIYNTASDFPSISLLLSVTFISRAIKDQQNEGSAEQAHLYLHLRQPRGEHGHKAAAAAD